MTLIQINGNELLIYLSKVQRKSWKQAISYHSHPWPNYSKYRRYNSTYLYLDVSYQLQNDNSSRYLKNGEHNK